MHGAFFFACSKRSRTLDAPTPTNISTKSEPEIEKNGTPASPATALASRVLPVPGGPISKTPFGILAPRVLNLSGFFRNSTISCSSSFSSSAPATSAKTFFFSPSPEFLIFALPKLSVLSPPRPPDILFIIMTQTTTIIMISPIFGITDQRIALSTERSISYVLIVLFGSSTYC